MVIKKLVVSHLLRLTTFYRAESQFAASQDALVICLSSALVFYRSKQGLGLKKVGSQSPTSAYYLIRSRRVKIDLREFSTRRVLFNKLVRMTYWLALVTEFLDC